MAQWKSALPYGLSDDMGFDRGTSCLGSSPRPGSIWHAVCGGRSSFDSAIRGLEAEIANAGAYLVIDGETRSTYARLVRGMADDLAGQVKAGRLTWARTGSAGKRVKKRDHGCPPQSEYTVWSGEGRADEGAGCDPECPYRT